MSITLRYECDVCHVAETRVAQHVEKCSFFATLATWYVLVDFSSGVAYTCCSLLCCMTKRNELKAGRDFITEQVDALIYKA